MTNSRANTSLQKIENYANPSTTTAKTFTFAAIDFEKISKLILIIDGEATAALGLELLLNGLTDSQYYHDGRRITGAAETLLDTDTAAEETFLSTTDITGTQSFHAEIEIYQTGPTLNLVHYDIKAWTSLQHNIELKGFHNAVINSLTSLTIQVSTSTIKAGFRATLYKVMR